MKKTSRLKHYATLFVWLFAINILVLILINKFIFKLKIRIVNCNLEKRIQPVVSKSKSGHGKSFSLWNIQQFYQQLSIDQFNQIYEDLFPLGGEYEFLEHMYCMFKKNSDRYVYILDLLCSLPLISLRKPERKLEWQFTWYDLDNDGYITRNEMLEIIKALHENTYRDLKVPNKTFFPERVIDQIVSQLDQNMDCQLSLNEFIKYSKSDRIISKLLLQCKKQESKLCSY